MVRHDYQCVSCRGVREYEHTMNSDPERCLECGSTQGLVKKLSAPYIASSKKSDSCGGCIVSEIIGMGISIFE